MDEVRFKIDFEKLDWQTPIPGARFKAFQQQGKQIRLVEFTSEFVEPHWCEKGHVGIVLKGELEIDFRGNQIRYPQGTAIYIPAGKASGHKARSITPLVQLFLMEALD